LLVYVNSKISFIEFHIRQSRDFPIFIEDELFDLKIIREADHFVYRFEINKKAETPRNVARNKLERKNLFYTLGFWVGFIGIAISLTLLMNWHSKKKNFALIKNEHYTAPAKVFIEKEQEGDLQLRYYYIVKNRSYKATISQSEFLPSGLPIQSGDEFTVYYEFSKPSVHQIDFSRPTELQIERYKKRYPERHETSGNQEPPDVSED